MIDNRMTPELCAVFVARFVKPATTLSYLGTIVTAACRACRWEQSLGTSKRFREIIERRFGDVFSLHGKNTQVSLQFNSAFSAARRWAKEHDESALNWPGDVIEQPELVMPQPKPEPEPETKGPTEEELMRLRMLTMHTETMVLLRDKIGRAADAMQVVREALTDIRCAAAGEIGRHAAELKQLQDLLKKEPTP